MLWISDLSDRLKRILNRKSSNIRALDKGDDTILNFLVYQNGDDSNIMDYDPKFNDILVQEKGLCFKTYYENWENQTFESLLEVEGALELELIFEGEVLYRVFEVENREKDLNQMRELYSQKLEKLYFNLS
ncbi:TPA: hypothetical protein TXL59_002303 [Streptococcus suis]|nr:hypothetical protein [Streptococcus suis]HEL1603911.1 hypothetical protein [Streptococcus suis]